MTKKEREAMYAMEKEVNERHAEYWRKLDTLPAREIIDAYHPFHASMSVCSDDEILSVTSLGGCVRCFALTIIERKKV